MKVCGLREKIEGKDLIGYLTDLFTSCEIEFTISSAYRVGIYRPTKYPRNIIVKFPYWNVKANVQWKSQLDHYRL